MVFLKGEKMDKFKEITAVEQNKIVLRMRDLAAMVAATYNRISYMIIKVKKLSYLIITSVNMGMNTPLYMMAVNFGIAQKEKTKKFQQALQKSIISLLMIGMRLLDVIILYGTVMKKLYVLSGKKFYINL